MRENGFIHLMSGKKLAKNTLALYIRMGLAMLVSIYTSRIVLSTLGVTDFGIYNLVGGIVVLFSFFSESMNTSTQRFLSFELGKKNFTGLNKIFSLSILTHFIIAIVIIILSESIGVWFLNTQLVIPPDRLNAANWVFQFSVLTFAYGIMTLPYNAVIIAHEEMSVYAYIGILEVILKLIIVYLLTYFNYDKLKLYAILTFAVTVIVRVIYQIYCRRKYEECRLRFYWNRELFVQMLNFSGWNLIGSFSFVLRTYGSNMLLNIFFGPALNAAKGIASQLDNALNNFVTNFQTALNPQIIKSYAENDRDQTNNLIYRGGMFSFFLLFILTMPILYQMETVLKLWLNNVPDYTVIFAQLTLINTLINTITKPIIVLAQATGKVKMFQILQGGFYLLALPIIYLFLKLNSSPVSVMIVLCTFTFVGTFVRIILVKQIVPYFSIRSFIKKVLFRILWVAIFSSILCKGISYFLYQNSSFIGLVINSIVLCGIVSCCIWTLGLQSTERESIVAYIKTKIKR